MNLLKLITIVLFTGGIGTLWYQHKHLRHNVQMPTRHTN